MVAGTAVILSDIKPIDGTAGTVARFRNVRLKPECVILRGLQFTELTFLREEEVPLDVPIRVHFQITFEDESSELLNTSVGGTLVVPPRAVCSIHVNPAAAIVSSIDSGHWYQWYYAVSA